MARWSDVEADAPEFAARAKTYLDARKHKTIATLRPDGSPRISGTECLFVNGDMWFGSMWQATKALDLIRDSRFAFHSGTADPPDWTGDAKVSGNAVEITDRDTMAKVFTDMPEGPVHLFKADIGEVVVVTLSPERSHLVVEVWREGKGITSYKR